MAGTITVSTISDGTNSTSSTNCIKGSSKAWANWVGSTGAINASYNVSSITRTGTGVYTVAFTTAFSDASYVLTFCNYSGNVIGSTDTVPTTTGFTARYYNGSNYDSPVTGFAAFR